MLSSGEDYEIHEEFLEKPLLKRIEISESGEPGTWNVINFTGERGVFHYEGQVAETTGPQAYVHPRGVRRRRDRQD